MNKVFNTLFLLVIFLMATIGLAHATSVNPVTVCQSGCDYESIQEAVENTISTDSILVTSDLYGTQAQLDLSDTSINLHDVNISCQSNQTLDAQGASTLVSGGMPRDFSLSGCTLAGASNLVDIYSDQVSLKKNTFLVGSLEISGIATIDSNTFVNSTLKQTATGSAFIVNNVFSTTGSSQTAIFLAPSVDSSVLHNTVKGYHKGVEFYSPVNYRVYNNLITNANIAYSVITGAYVDTYHTLVYEVGTIRQSAPGWGSDFSVINKNPLFIDIALHISRRSPAVNRGSLDAGITYDKDGVLRYNRPDIGAYEASR